MLRRLFTLASVVSAVLGLGVLVLWGRACFVAEFLTYNTGRAGVCYGVEIHSGAVAVTKTRWAGRANQAAGWNLGHLTRDPVPDGYGYFRVWGRFDAVSGSGGWNRHFWGVSVPFWVLLLAASAVPGWRLAARSVAWLKVGPAPGTCRACGYDLRATPGRCPECGTAPAP